MADKKRIDLVSATSFAAAVKNKWLVFGGAFVLVVFVLMMFTTSDTAPRKRAAPEPGFVDATPENSNDKMVLSQIQAQLREMNEAMAKQQEQAAKLRAAQEKEVAELKEQNQKAIDAALSEYKKKVAAELEAERAKSAALADMQSGGIIIPSASESGGKSKVPPPPPIYISEADRQAQQRAESRPLLPQNTIQGGGGLNKPMIITGESGSDSAYIMTGSELKDDSQKKTGKSSFLAAGSFVEAAIITGADFGAGKQTEANPQPSLLRIQNNAFLPGGARYQMRDCFALASGYGDLSSERAYLQVTRLSCVRARDGKVMEAAVLAYIADSDGKLGMRGILNRRQGALLAKAMLAGFADGASTLLSAVAQGSEQTITGAGVVTSINPDRLGEAAGWSGVAGAMDKLAEQYIKEAESIFPVIEIDAGRKATIVFQQGQNLEWKDVTGDNNNA